MDQEVASDETFFRPLAGPDRKSQGSPAVRRDMRYVMLVILIGLLVFLSNQLWILFEGQPLF
jgi:hypothetical protein